jgi:hypothetical protein
MMKERKAHFFISFRLFETQSASRPRTGEKYLNDFQDFKSGMAIIACLSIYWRPKVGEYEGR